MKALWLIILLIGLLNMAIPQTSPPGVGENARLSQEFQSRAAKYLDLRKQVAGKSTRPSNSPEALTASQKELGSKIRRARSGAKQGEIFTPELSSFFRRQVSQSLSGPHGNEIQASLRHGEPANGRLQVNEVYPEKLPLQSAPPSLLLNLPPVPEGLEYRIVGRDLVLRDTEANIVVDFIPNIISRL